ncbi:hypothetical protein QBC37DRAFT_98773 [Rhypophila decipiens]|uniref:Uncharacterized protein n=1 Tax=Rhypophila decipiens TaxID=261697 RepID=A0AAN7B2A9_9PEZI|nr:hypothetical protein QBC37DRAFT_98773 [Rhypophila decipiens]
MRSTGPTLRRRQWRQKLRARHEDEDHANDADGEDHADHSDSGSDDDDEDEAKPRFFRPAVQPNTVVSTGPNLGAGAGVTVGPNPGSGVRAPTGLPESTLGAGEGDIEAEDEEDEEEEEESESDSDDEPSDGDESSSDDDSDEEEATVPPPGPPSTTTGPAAIAPPGATGTIASGGTASPTAGSPPVLAPIGGIMSQVQPPTTSTSRQETTLATQTTASPSTTSTTSISETTSVSQPSVGEVDRIVTSTPEPTSLADAAPVLSDGSGGGMETGAAAGIIVGTLAFVGILLIGGWFLYKKMRRDPVSDSDSDSSAPPPKFSPPKFFNFRSSVDRSTYSWKFWDTNSSAGTRTTVAPAPAPALAPPQLPFANKKTNSEMVDQLMQAAYAAESGGNYNDLESRAGYWDEKSQAGAPVPHPTQVNEKTYKALFGNGPNSPMPPTAPTMPFVGKPSNQGRPLTNGGNPMMRWLDATATPRQSKFGPPPSAAGLRPDQDR